MPKETKQQVGQEKASRVQQNAVPQEKTVNKGMTASPDLSAIENRHTPLIAQGAIYFRLASGKKKDLNGNQKIDMFPVLPSGISYPVISEKEFNYAKEHGATTVSMNRSDFFKEFNLGHDSMHVDIDTLPNKSESLKTIASYTEKYNNELSKAISSKYFGGYPYYGFIDNEAVDKLKEQLVYNIGELQARVSSLCITLIPQLSA